HRQGGADRDRGRRPRGEVSLGAGIHAAGLHESGLGRDAARVRREARREVLRGSIMDIEFTPKQQAFRAEVRAWLRDNAPREPFLSYDTREGFEQHRAWEAKLAEAGYSSVTWPKELGGRGCDLI